MPPKDSALKNKSDDEEIVGRKPDTPSTQLAAATGSGGVPAPFLQNYDGPMGTENIDNADVAVPRIKIGQSMNDEVKDGRVVEGSLFINVNGEVLWRPGDDPLPVHIVNIQKEYALWRPRKDGDGGILARARPVKTGGVIRYEWDKPNTKFDVKVEGKVAVTWETKRYVDEDKLNEWGTEIPGNEDSGPAATETHNYLLMFPTRDCIVAAASLARSAVRVARNLNAIIKMGPPRVPLPLRRYTLQTVDDVGGNSEKFKNWQFAADGLLIDGQGNLLREEYREIAMRAMDAFQHFSKTSYVVDQSDAAGAETTKRADANDAGSKDEIPF
jgi:hypothetical protein